MPAAEPAMSPSDVSVGEVLDRATGPRRAEVDELLEMHREVSGEEPVVWAGRILGFGQLAYRYDSGREGIAPLLAFAPGPTKHTLYLANAFSERWPDLMEQLGTYRASKVCLYITRLSKVDGGVLRQMLERTLAESLCPPKPL